MKIQKVPVKPQPWKVLIELSDKEARDLKVFLGDNAFKYHPCAAVATGIFYKLKTLVKYDDE